MSEIALLLITLVASYIDVKKRIIPNKLILIGLILGIIFSIFNQGYVYIVVSFLMAVLFALFFEKGIGYGDKKLLSIIPLFLWEKTPMFFFILSIVYLFYYYYQKTKKVHKLPFAPGILLAVIITVVI